MAIVYDSALELASGSQRKTLSKVYWHLMPILLGCFLASYLDRVNVGFAKLQMLDALKFDDAIFGLGAGMFFAGYFLFEVPSNLMLRKVGAPRWIARIMLTWGVISAATLFAHTPGEFYLARFLLGLAEAGFTPAVIYLLTLWFPASYRGRAMAIFTMGAPLAFILGGPISGMILKGFEGSQLLAPWQWLFLIEALPAILMAFVVLRFLDDEVGKASWLSVEEREMIKAELKREDIGKSDHASISQFLASRYLWVFCLVFFCMIMGLYALGFWLPSLIKQSGVTDPVSIGMYAALPNILGMFSLYFSTRSADKTKLRRAHFATFMTIGAIGLAAAMAAHGGPYLTIACLSVAAIGVYAALALFWALPTAAYMGVTAAAAVAVINSVGNLAGFVSPYLVGGFNVFFQRTDFGMYVISAFLLLGAITTMRLSKTLDK